MGCTGSVSFNSYKVLIIYIQNSKRTAHSLQTSSPLTKLHMLLKNKNVPWQKVYNQLELSFFYLHRACMCLCLSVSKILLFRCVWKLFCLWSVNVSSQWIQAEQWRCSNRSHSAHFYWHLAVKEEPNSKVASKKTPTGRRKSIFILLFNKITCLLFLSFIFFSV